MPELLLSWLIVIPFFTKSGILGGLSIALKDTASIGKTPFIITFE